MTAPPTPGPPAHDPDDPRDATRGGVNGPASSGQPPADGKIRPLPINEPPPFWGRWGRIYLLVAGLLAVETFVFWWLARWAS
jgi:hypothetical protein